MTVVKPKEDHNWRESMFIDWSTNYEDFFTEHDTTLGDGYERDGASLIVEGLKYGQLQARA